MADSNQPAAPKRKRYEAPKLETVEIVAEEAMLAACVMSATNPTPIQQGGPCSSCASGTS